MKVNLLKLDKVPIFEQLQLEEALLRADGANWCILNTGSTDAIVMGISGKPEKLIDQALFKKKPVPLIKRFSGGGTVYIDSDTYFVTFIFNANGMPQFPHEIMEWTELFYRPVFSPLDFKLQENDYLLGDKKFGGNAQYICKNRWLHHSSLLWNFCPKKMEVLLLPERRPKYRKDRSHTDFLTPLKAYLTKEIFEKRLIDTLYQRFDIQEESLETVTLTRKKNHRKSTSLIT